MKTKLRLGVSIAALAILGATAGLVRQGSANNTAARAERKVLFYQDSMHPWVKSDRPGKCTICEMDLTPIYEGQAGFGSSNNVVVISSNQVTVLNVQTEAVKRRPLSRALRVAGSLEANETSKTVVSAPARGRIDALSVDYAGVEVEQGQKLITMFSPELVQLRKTLLAVRQTTQQGGTNTLPKPQSDSGLYTGDILAPQSGVVLERNVYTGQYVAEGDRLLTIVDASVLWFRFDVYQRQLPWFEPGETIEVEVSGIPGKVFPAVISFIEPTFNDATRTVKVRADIRNPVVEVNGHKRRQLKYGMYAEGLVRAQVPQVLAVPRSAILFPGGAAYAYVDKGAGAYERRRLKLGRQGDEFWEVLKGVVEGESVVTSGNMLIDAQAQFNNVSRLEEKDSEEVTIDEAVSPYSSEHEVMCHPEPTPRAVESLAASDSARKTSPASFTATPVKATTMKLPVTQQAAAGRTDRMSTLMSPGAELQMLRRATILQELAMKASNAPPPVMASPQPPMATKATQSPQANEKTLTTPTAETDVTPLSSSVQPPNNALLTHRQVDAVRRATSEEMRQMRLAAIAEANQKQAPDAPSFTAAQRESLQAFLTEAGGVSQALAADNLESFNGHIAQLPALLQPLTNAFPTTSPLSPLLQRLAVSKWQAAKDLADARKQFLPFSTTVVDLAKLLKKQDEAFASIKIYHCPMAPEPGLWIQTQGPLANAFYGSKMLRCGEEVTP